MHSQRILCALSACALFALSWILSGCGGGSTPATGGTLTGSAAVSSSAVSRVGRASIGSLQEQLNRIRPPLGSPLSRSRGRQGLDFDEELGLYYRYRVGSSGVWIELFEDSAGQRPAGEIVCKEDDSSYETIVSVGEGAQQQRAYFRIVETSNPERFKLRARYEDPRTGERQSIEGDLIVEPSSRPSNEEENPAEDWTEEFEWWENDGYCGDDYFGGEDEFFGEEEYFDCPDEAENDNYASVDDFVVVGFEGTITYEGCGATVSITCTLDYTTGVLSGEVAIDETITGSVECDYDTNQGQMTLDTPQGQVQVVFNGDVIEARYPNGRIERVNPNQWANPCAGVSQAQRASRAARFDAFISIGGS
ncbi:MAG: hypothetical protein WHS44_08740 [Fimbriimonadales bacterium]|nr:MAG: hypothetical protein KatS3mg018_1613 [Fimbriimonadales bacterium]